MLNFRLAALAIAALFLTVSAGYTAETEPGYKANVEHGLDLAKSLSGHFRPDYRVF